MTGPIAGIRLAMMAGGLAKGHKPCSIITRVVAGRGAWAAWQVLPRWGTLVLLTSSHIGTRLLMARWGGGHVSHQSPRSVKDLGSLLLSSELCPWPSTGSPLVPTTWMQRPEPAGPVFPDML